MDFKIVQRDKMLLAGYRANTAQSFSVIKGCWERLNGAKGGIPNRVDENTLIALDDYTSNFACEGQPAFDYYAAVEVSSLSGLPGDMAVKELPAGKYVVFSFWGSPQDSMQPVVDYIYQEWFPQSTAQLDENNMIDFAMFSEELDGEGRGRVELWVPIL